MADKILKARNWTGLIYPDDCKENWLSILDDAHVPYALSPLHDKDENDDGSLKKAHHHIIVSFDGPTTEKVVQDLLDSLAKDHAPRVQIIRSIRSSYRYLTHKDNPEKYQYSESGIRFGGGFDLNDILTQTEIIEMQIEIIEVINKYDFCEFEDLVNYFIATNNKDYLHICLNKSTYSLGKYLASKRYKKQTGGDRTDDE